MHDLRRALLDGLAFPVQLSRSAAVVASYIAIFVMAGRAVQVDMSGLMLAMLAGPVLMSMLVPVTIAGRGLREGANASAWDAARVYARVSVRSHAWRARLCTHVRRSVRPLRLLARTREPQAAHPTTH